MPISNNMPRGPESEQPCPERESVSESLFRPEGLCRGWSEEGPCGNNASILKAQACELRLRHNLSPENIARVIRQDLVWVRGALSEKI